MVHLCRDVSELNNASTDILSGTIANALGQGKKGITLELAQEMAQFGFPEPSNMTEITQWVRTTRGA